MFFKVGDFSWLFESKDEKKSSSCTVFVSYVSLFFSPAEANGPDLTPLTVKLGDEVTLHCESVTCCQNNCNSTVWSFNNNTASVTLFELGQSHRDAAAQSDRLSVTANCSLVIKKVTDEDVGRYTCRGQRLAPVSGVQLSVINSEYLHHKVFSSNCLVRTTHWNITIIMITVIKLILLLLSFSHNISIFSSDWTAEQW